MSYCGACGRETGQGDKFCRACGATLDPADGDEPSATQPGSWEPRLGLTRAAGFADPPDGKSARRRSALVTVVVALAVVAVAATVGIGIAVTHASTKGSTGGTALPGAAVQGSRSTRPPPTFASLYSTDVSGVIRIDATTCSGTGVGSGFLVAPELVATAAHVVDGAVSLGLSNGGATKLGTVVGIDDSTDVALVRTNTPLNGHVFKLAKMTPPVGTSIGVIGYPEGGPVSFSQGSITGLSRSVDIEGEVRSGLMQTDAALNPGNSGGPLFTLSNSVVGFVDAGDTQASGIGYAVAATTAASLLSRWQAAPAQPPAPHCSNPLGPSQSGGIQGRSTLPPGITATLTTYFDAIDAGDYATAYAQLAPDARGAVSEASFAAADATSYDFAVSVSSATQTSPTAYVVDVHFTSLQSPAAGPNGDSCDNWRLQDTMVMTGGSWYIESALGQNGVTHTTC